MFGTVTLELTKGLWTTFQIFILTLVFALPGRIDSWYRKCQQMETAPLSDSGLCLDHPGNATDASAHHYLLRTGSRGLGIISGVVMKQVVLRQR